MHIVVIDVMLDVKIRVISLYRSFRPETLSPNEFFKGQLGVLKNAIEKNCFIMGDFNLDAGMEDRRDYGYKIPLELLASFALENDLLQVVTFNTWKRIISGVIKQSCLDHIYVNCPETIISVNQIDPTFGDHLLVYVELNLKDLTPVNCVFKRNRKNYNDAILKQKLQDSLESVKFCWQDLNVQEHWNCLENLLVNIVDELAPLVVYDENNGIKVKKSHLL